ncbi:MAG: hypothetical protein UW16_C0002G0022 [Microgenomates group bacterium GW2011_GWC1_44_10]|nr:MAG: hypothetical protein UW16_C0002G0022 [Microgenomates group bacterium GW2011_GWC1_44_10]
MELYIAIIGLVLCFLALWILIYKGNGAKRATIYSLILFLAAIVMVVIVKVFDIWGLLALALIMVFVAIVT